MFNAILFVAAAVLAWALAYGTLRWARRIKLLDIPNQRSMHRQATPRGGGAAIVTVCLLGLAAAAIFGLRPEWPADAGYLAGALLIVAVSFADDVRTVPSGLRLAFQVLGGALIVAGLAIQSELVPVDQAGLGWLLVAAGLLWTVGLTNTYNFMDGIDGLAATQGIVAGLGWTVLATLSHQPWLAILALLVSASCAGFLVHNWPPASIFMGDVGSAFLGFTFAFITLAALRQTPAIAFIGAMLLWPFIFDVTFTMLRRLGRGENIFVGHRSHLYQRLVLAGWRQGAVTSVYGLFAMVTFLLGTGWWLAASANFGYSVIAVVFLLSLVLWTLVIRAERKMSGTPDPRALLGR
jgi:UDP-N-acetylmuramyl pentapeptide phosphotransferase/UDP-N-acetylglucosamine-1-phosphate transferase